jgi:hypothetical protein
VQNVLEQNLGDCLGIALETVIDWLEWHSTVAVADGDGDFELDRLLLEHSVQMTERHQGETSRKAGLD